MSETSELKAHPFELSGMGTGPYRFVGMVSIPSSSLAEANPTAYNNALAMLPRNLVGGCGICYHCGTAIMNICIVIDAQGVRYGIGSDCVLKTGDASLGDKVKVAVAKHRARLARAKKDAAREARRIAWLNASCNELGETNAQRIERERNEAQAAQVAREAVVFEKFGFLLPHLGAGNFCESIASGIRSGREPRGGALDILREIYAKSAGGKRGSKAFCASWDAFNAKLGIE